VGWVVREGVRTLAEDKTKASAYASFRFPVILVTGERSPAAAAAVVRRLGAAIHGARVERIAEVGHLAPVTHTDLVNPVLYGALEGASAQENRP
jgi:pimeloyl-ACP methyl ester carboxylesterase